MCVCVGGLTSTAGEPHLCTRGSLEAGCRCSLYPYYLGIFRMPPMFSCLQRSSHRGGPTCLPRSPDSKSTLPMHISHL